MSRSLSVAPTHLPPRGSAAPGGGAIARLAAAEERLGAWARQRGPWTAGLHEFVRFGVKQGWACLFGGLLLALILATHLLWPRLWPQGAPIARYDVLFLAALAIQAGLLAFRLETWGEARVILVFHLVGTAMELFKTAQGSWLYPEPNLLRIGGVPLFTGFMYAAVGSYIARCWRLFEFRFTGHPPTWAVLVLAVAIYVNFFTHHVGPDLRLGLFALTALLFGRCWIWFRPWHAYRRMPLLLGFGLVALFIWFAENLGTFAGAWLYPHQRNGWTVVPPSKLGAWFLLMLLSYALVLTAQVPRARLKVSTSLS